MAELFATFLIGLLLIGLRLHLSHVNGYNQTTQLSHGYVIMYATSTAVGNAFSKDFTREKLADSKI